MNVLFVYRSKDLKMHSIENCFGIISQSFPKAIHCDSCFVPKTRAGFLSILKNALFVRKVYKKKKYDIVHITGDVHYACLFLPREKTILTIHDVRGIHTYKGAKRFLYKMFWIRIPVSKCEKIVCISPFTLNEVIATISKKDCNKLTIIPDPVNNDYYSSPKPFNSKKPAILMIGTIPNKNVERAICAIEGINCSLTIVGKLSNRQIEVLNKYNVNYTNLINLKDEDIFKEYVKSDLVLFPSTYEGFGMIVIEAQKVGRVVVTSDIEPLKSVSGNGACLVNPFDIESIKSGVLTVMRDEEYRNQLISEGFKNASKYSADAVAKQYIELYLQITKHKR